MAGLTVYSKDGQTVRTVLNKWQYNGEYMGDRKITATVNSPVKIDWQIDDYVYLRGQYFKIKATPPAKKQARRGEYGAGLVYENVVFQSIVNDLVVIQFKDYTIGDNLLHYSGLDTFSFYMTKPDDLANRILANLILAYGEGVWNIIIATEDVYDSDGEILVHGTPIEITDKSVSVSSGTNLHDALNLYNSMFELNYIITVINGVNTIIVGGDTTINVDSWGYGEGRGLKSLTQSRDESEAIVTRLHAYGSTRNLPFRYYNKKYNDKVYYPELFDENGKYLLEATYINKLMLPYNNWVIKSKMYDAYIDSETIAKYGLREGTVTFDGSDEKWQEIYPSLEGMRIHHISPGMTGYYTGASEEQQTIFTTLQAWLADQTGHTYSEAWEFLARILIDYNNEDKTQIPLVSGWRNLVQAFYAGTNPHSYCQYIEYQVNEYQYVDAHLARGGISKRKIEGTNRYLIANGSFEVYFYYYEPEWTIISGYGLDNYNVNRYGLGSSAGAWVNRGKLVIGEISTPYHWEETEGSDYEFEDGVKVRQLIIITKENVTPMQIAKYNSAAATAFVNTFQAKLNELMYKDGIYQPWSTELDISRNHQYKITQAQINQVTSYLYNHVPDNEGRLDMLVEGSGVIDNGVMDDNSGKKERKTDTNGAPIEDEFYVTIPQVFFNIEDFFDPYDKPMLCMKSGMCAGRSFEILGCEELSPWEAGYRLRIARDDSDIDTMNMYFPNSVFQLQSGDQYVLTGIYMPDIYVESAEVRLLNQAEEYLAEYDHEVYQYAPELDNQFLASHPALANKIQEGLTIQFNDRDAGDEEGTTGDLNAGDVKRYIKTLTIKYQEEYLPKYEVALTEKPQNVTLQQMLGK